MDGLKARLSFDAVAYDYDDEYLTIDTDTHTININNVSRLFGVQYDGNSKLIKFRIRNKLSDIQKMQDSIVYINWIDSKGVKGQSIAIDKTISNDICEFAWKVPFDALKNSGVLHFAMSAVMTKNSSSVIDQRWSTQIASVITPDGIYIKSYTPSSEEEDRIAQIYNELSKMINTQSENLQSQVNSLNEALESYGNFVNMFDESDFEVGNKYVDGGHIVSELSRKDRISTTNTVHLNSGCEIYTITDNIAIIIYKKSSDIYTFVDDAKTKNQKIKIEDSGDYLIVIGVLPERSKEINHVNELLSYCYYTFEPYNVIEKIDDSLYTTYYTSNSNLIVKALDEINHYAYYRVPRQINYGEKISITIKSNSMSEQLPVDWNIITCNGFGEKYIDDTCGIQRQSYPSNLNMVNEQYDIEVKRDFTYIGLYIHDSKNADFELTFSFKKSTTQSIQKDNILTVMTYNVDRFSLVNSNEEMHSIILEKYGVDIAGIQEYRETINNNSIFTNVFTDYKYHHQNTLIPNPSGIVSKKKLFSVNDYLFTHQSKEEESPTEYVEVRGYSKSYIYVNGKKICWINTHIDLNEKTRYLQLAELRNIMLSEEYAILTGDLNTSKIIDSTSVEWKNAIKPFLDSDLKCANNNDTYGYNWTWADLNFIKTAKVDNIIVTPNIDFVEVVFDKTRMDYINSTDVPEHNPIIVKLRIN